MSKPSDEKRKRLEQYIKSAINFDELNADETRKAALNYFGDDFDDELFSELIVKYAPPVPLQPQITDKPFSQMSVDEQLKFEEEQVPPFLQAEVEEELQLKPESFDVRKDLRKDSTFFKEKADTLKQLKTKAENTTDPAERKRLETELYTNMLGGERLLQIADYTEQEMLEMTMPEKTKVAMSYMPEPLGPMDKFVYALNMNRLKEYSTKNLGEAHQVDRYPEQKIMRDVAYSLDRKIMTVPGIEKFYDVVTDVGPKEFEKLNKLTPDMFPPNQQQQVVDLQKGMSKVLKETQIILDEGEIEINEDRLIENQQVLFGLVNTLNSLIPSEDLKLSTEAFYIDVDAPINTMDLDSEEARLLNLSNKLQQSNNPSDFTEAAIDRIKQLGGEPTASSQAQTSASTKALNLAAGMLDFAFEEGTQPKLGARKLLIEEINNKIQDLEKEKSKIDPNLRTEKGFEEANQIFRIDNTIDQLKETKKSLSDITFQEDLANNILSGLQDTIESTETSQVLRGALDQDLNEMMETIRRLNQANEQDPDFLNTSLEAMMRLESMVHSAANPNETSLDGDRIRLAQMTANEFLDDQGYYSREMDKFPIYMQNIIIQNTNKKRNGEDISVKELREMTLGEIDRQTDLRQNLDTRDIQRFVEYRDEVNRSAPADAINFFLDIGSTPTFDPETQTYTKKVNGMGYMLYYMAPAIPRVLTENVVGALEAGATEGPAAAVSQFTGLEEVLDYLGYEGYSNLPSWSSRVAAKLAVGDPGLMGDVPYLLDLYGFSEETQRAGEFAGLVGDFVIPFERVALNVAKRPMKTVAKYKYARFKEGDVGNYTKAEIDNQKAFGEAIIDAGIGLPSRTEKITEIALPLATLTDAAVFGTGVPLTYDMGVQGIKSAYGMLTGNVSDVPLPRNVLNYKKLKENQQQFIDEIINERINNERVFTSKELIELKQGHAFEQMLDNGFDPNNIEAFAQKMFPVDTKMREDFIRNTTILMKKMDDNLNSSGLDLQTVYAKHRANETEATPHVYAEARARYLENSSVNPKVKNSESYKRVEQIIKNNGAMSEADKNMSMAFLFAVAKTVEPLQPEKYFDRVVFESKSQPKKNMDAFFNSIGKFVEQIEDDRATLNDLFRTLKEEPASTRGVKNFYAEKQVDGVPALFDEADPNATDIDKTAVVNHYQRSLNREVKNEVKTSEKAPSQIYTPQYLDIELSKVSRRIEQYTKRLQDKDIEITQKEAEIEATTDTQIEQQKNKELFKLNKEREKIERAQVSAEEKGRIFQDLGTEIYLLDQKNKESVNRIKQDPRFFAEPEEVKAIAENLKLDREKITAPITPETLVERQRTKREALKRFDVEAKERMIDQDVEKLAQKEIELENNPPENILDKQALVEEIESLQQSLLRLYNTKGIDESNVKVYSLGGKNEKARVRFSDYGDGTYRVETMRNVMSQKKQLNLNLELYYRSEFVKSIIEDASYNGYNQVIIPLGENGIFHETMGKRVRTEDYLPFIDSTQKIKQLKKNRTEFIKETGDISALNEEQRTNFSQSLNDLNLVVDEAIKEYQQLSENMRVTEAHPRLQEIDDFLTQIVKDYVGDIDDNAKVEVVNNEIVVHLTDDFKNVLGRTIKEDPSTSFVKGMRFKKPDETLPVLPDTNISETQANLVKETKRRLNNRKGKIDEKIKKQKNTARLFKVENQNIKIQLEKLDEFLKTGYLDTGDSNIQFFQRSDGKTVISIGDYNIIAREFEHRGKKGILFETLISKTTGEEIEHTTSDVIKRARAYEEFKRAHTELVEDLTIFAPYLKYFEKYIREQGAQGLTLKQSDYIQFRKALGIEDEPHAIQEKYSLNKLLKEDTPDQAFKDIFVGKAQLLDANMKKQDLSLYSVVRKGDGTLRSASQRNKQIQTFDRQLNQRFEAKEGPINATVYRLTDEPLTNVYKDSLDPRKKGNQNLDMNSLSISNTTDLLTNLLSKDVELFAFDSASDHMMQNFSDILDQVGGSSSPNIIKGRNKVYPMLDLGITKDPTKSFFGQDLNTSINTDLRNTIEYLGREKVSDTEQAKINVVRKIFDVDETLDVAEQKQILKNGNDFYQTYQPKRTANTYFGLKKKSVQRLIDGLDENIDILKRSNKFDDADLLIQKKKELADQQASYAQLENDAVVFTFGGDKLNTDILHFAPDQTGGFGKLRGVMSDLEMVDENFSNVLLSMEEIKKSYVENSVLDTVQQGFDSFGMEISLRDSKSVETLRAIAQRFGTDLQEVTIRDLSGEVPQSYRYLAFKFPDELKQNVDNVTTTRVVRSIETKDPVMVNGNTILRLFEEGEVKVRTPYGELVLRTDKDALPDDLGTIIETTIMDINTVANRVDFGRFFDSLDFENAPDGVVTEYQQSLYAKGVAREFQERLKNEHNIDIEIQGLDEIENVGLDQIQRASKGNREIISLSPEEQAYLQFNSEEIDVIVDYDPSRPLSTEELIALEQGVGLNRTLAAMEEIIQEGQRLGYDTKTIFDILGFKNWQEQVHLDLFNNKKLPFEYEKSTFADHPKGAYSLALPLLFLEYKDRLNLNNREMVRFGSDADLAEPPTIARPTFTEGDVISQIEIDGERLKVRVTDNMSVSDFIVVNANILEILMPQYGYKNLLNKYDSMRGRLTQSGVKQFASEMINYLETDRAPDLKTRSVMDHTLGMLSQIWDLAHRQDVPESMAQRWNTIFNPVGRAAQEAARLSYRKHIKFRSKIGATGKLDAISAGPAKRIGASVQERLGVYSTKDLLERINQSPNIRKLQRSAVTEDGRPLYRFGALKVGDEIDPKTLLTTLFGIIRADEISSPKFQNTLVGKLFDFVGNRFTEERVKVTDQYYAPVKLRDQLDAKVNAQLRIIFGEKLNFDATTERITFTDNNQRDMFLSVLNSLGDIESTALVIPGTLVKFLHQPEGRNFITKSEYNAFQNALLNREAPIGYSNRKVDVLQNQNSIFKKFSKALRDTNTTEGVIQDIMSSLSNFLGVWIIENAMDDLPISIQPAFSQYRANLSKASQELTRLMRSIVKEGNEAKSIIKRYRELGLSEVEAQAQADQFLKQSNTAKKLALVNQVIENNMRTFEVVDRSKIPQFYKMYDNIFEPKSTNIFEMFSIENLDQIQNVLTSKKNGISDANRMAVQTLRKYTNQYIEFKRNNPNDQFILGKEALVEINQMIMEIKQSFKSRYNLFDQIVEKLFKRLTGYTKTDKGLSGYTSIINRKLLSLLFEGRILEDPSIDKFRRRVLPEHIFDENTKGQIIFKDSGEVLTKESATQFLYNNGYGFINDTTSFKFTGKDNQISQSVKGASTIENLKNAVAEVIRFQDAQSLQTWMASDAKIKTNFLDFSPQTGRQDALTILGSVAILSQELLAIDQLATSLTLNKFQDLRTRLEERKQMIGNLFIDDTETFFNKVKDYVSNIASGTLEEVGGMRTTSKEKLVIIDGEMPKLEDSLNNFHAYEIALQIFKDLDIEIKATRKNVVEYELLGKKYLLPEDFVNGLEKMREEIIGSISLGRFGESQITDNMIIYMAEKNRVLDTLSEENKQKLLQANSTPKTAETDFKKAIYDAGKGILGFSFLTGLPIYFIYQNFGQGLALSLTGAVFTQKALTYAIIRENVGKVISKTLSIVGMEKVLNEVAMQQVANRLYFRFITDTMHLLPEKSESYQAIQKIINDHNGIKPRSPANSFTQNRLIEGAALTIGSFLAPHVGILQFAGYGLLGLGLGKGLIDYYGMRKDFAKNKAFVTDVQKLIDNDIEKFLQKLDDVAIDEDYAKNIDKWSRQIKEFQQYLAAPNRRFSELERNTDVFLKVFAEMYNLPKVSTNIKVGVTALSGPAYWNTSWFGLNNQHQLEHGITSKVTAAGAGFVIPYALTGSAMFGFQASRLAVVAHDYLKFKMHAKNRQMLNGGSAQHRPQQIAMLMDDIQETSLAARVGIEQATLGYLSGTQLASIAGTGETILPIAGVAIGTLTGLGLKKMLSKLENQKARQKFFIITEGGKIYTYKDILNLMSEHNVLTTYVREETGQLIADEARYLYPSIVENARYKNKLLNRTAMEIAESYDLYYRIGEFIDLLETGSRPEDAAKKIRDTYFDYSDLSPFEKKYLRNIVLFYSFQRKNLFFMARKFQENPERIMGWMRLTKDSQEYAHDRKDAELFTGPFMAGRLQLPPVDGLIKDLERVGAPTKEPVTVLPMSNVYDIMLMSSAALNNPFSEDPDGSFQKYLLTSMGPPAQALLIPFTEKVPFTERELRFQNIDPRMVYFMQKQFGHYVFGPKNSGALIEYDAELLNDSVVGGLKATAYRRAQKGLNPLAPYIYKPTDNSAGYMYNILSQSLLPATQATLAGKILFPFLPSGRAARTYDALDRIDALEKIVGASLIDQACRNLGYATNRQIIGQAVEQLRNRGEEINDELVAEEAKKIITDILNITANQAGTSEQFKQLQSQMCDIYIENDFVNINAALNVMGGLPSIYKIPEDALKQQELFILGRKRGGQD